MFELKNRSSYGHDYISNKILKACKTILAKPLALLINQSLSTGEFPKELKMYRVKPLFKNGNASHIYNFNTSIQFKSLNM